MENSVGIIEIMRNIHAYNNFFEKVLCQQQRCKFRGFLFFRIHLEGRLDIDFLYHSHLALATFTSQLSCVVYHKY